MASDDVSNAISTGNDVKLAIEEHSELSSILEVILPYKNDKIEIVDGERVSLGATGVIGFPGETTEYKYVMLYGHELVFGPGRSNTGKPFHTLGMVISFFVFWAITGMVQPNTMVG